MDFEAEKIKIGIRCKQIRKELGYTSHETFAYERELDRSQYGKIENGGYNLTLKVLVRTLNALNVDFSEFFNDEYNNIKVKK